MAIVRILSRTEIRLCRKRERKRKKERKRERGRKKTEEDSVK